MTQTDRGTMVITAEEYGQMRAEIKELRSKVSAFDKTLDSIWHKQAQLSSLTIEGVHVDGYRMFDDGTLHLRGHNPRTTDAYIKMIPQQAKKIAADLDAWAYKDRGKTNDTNR